MLNLHDTATGSIRPIAPEGAPVVSMYVCGPTVYDLPHLGHGRYVLVWDIARRVLLATGHDVRFVSNITDIDDNIINRATEEGRSEAEVAAEFEERWFEALDALSVLRPTEVPHATAYVEEMVALIGRLMDRGVAYRTSDGVYLDVSAVGDYGLLAGQPLDQLRAGARIVTIDEKRSPLDFVLWKDAKDGEPSWDAPFGAGRPGWHTECVVMSLNLLGEGFDLHTGGQDLKFPHHENERAQAVADGKVFANHWAHSGWVMVGAEKMSKSLKNFTSLTDLLATHDARAYRLLCVQSHYRAPLEVTAETIAAAEAALLRLDNLARRLDVPELPAGPVVLASHGVDPDAVSAFVTALEDDLDTPRAFAQVATLVSAANTAADDGDLQGAQALAWTVAVLLGVLGIRLRATTDVDEDAAALAASRDAARAAKDWSEADRLRGVLEALGYIVEDRGGATTLHR